MGKHVAQPGNAAFPAIITRFGLCAALLVNIVGLFLTLTVDLSSFMALLSSNVMFFFLLMISVLIQHFVSVFNSVVVMSLVFMSALVPFNIVLFHFED